MSAACVPAPLTTIQLQAVGSLLAGRSPADAARDCGISPRTLRSWRQQPDFHAALVEGQAQLLQQACLELAAAAAVAIRTLVQICEDRDQKGSVRTAAAGKLLHFLLQSAPPTAAPATPAGVGETAPALALSESSAQEWLSRRLTAAPRVSTPLPAAAPEFAPESAARPAMADESLPVARDPRDAYRLPRLSRPEPFAPPTRTSASRSGRDLLSDACSSRTLAARIPADPALSTR